MSLSSSSGGNSNFLEKKELTDERTNEQIPKLGRVFNRFNFNSIILKATGK